jgi:hypothetical protein
MKVRVIAGFVLLVSVLFINSCENNSAVPSSSLPGTCDTAALTYSSGPNKMQTVINTYCAISGCHVPGGGGGAPDYTSYSNLSLYASGKQGSLFWQYLFVNQTMPLSPQPPLTSCNQNKFKAWLSAGAPQ